jgi:glycosyltransferase involved in cell wall biosynthesis
VRATLIGDGPLRDRVAADVAARGLGGAVELVGHTENVAARLGELDVFLFTSHREGLSVAILEAMASGLPVVATDVGGTREQVVEGENGFVRAAGDVEGLAEACARLAASAALRERMGRASRARAEALFSAEGMVAGYAACYHDACEGKA